MIPYMTHIVESQVFPEAWKLAHIIPIPKVSEAMQYKGLRPIIYFPHYPSDYSCTIVLLKVTDDIISAVDNNEVTVLILLDYSKAFDRIHMSYILLF